MFQRLKEIFGIGDGGKDLSPQSTPSRSATDRYSHDNTAPKSQRTKYRSPPEKAGEDMVMLRPRNPWKQWGLAGFMSGEGDNSVRCHEDSSELRNSESTELNDFLLKLERNNEASAQNSINDNIFADVSSMIETVFVNLRDKCPVFKDSIVHKVGSVGEKTKVGLYTEFDFMIELASLKDRLLEEAVPFTQDKDPQNVVRVTNFHFLLDFVPDEKIVFSDSKEPDMFSTLKFLVSEELFAVLLPGWSPGPTLKIGDQEDKGKVRTIRLRYTCPEKNLSIDVFCDFSFSVPFEWNPERRFIFRRCNTAESLNDPIQTYRLLARNSEFWVVTNAVKERNKLVHSQISDNVKRVYRLAKMLNQSLLPPVYDFKLDTFEGLLPSYWLKQIILFMMDEYPEKHLWAEDFLGLRVYQLMTNLNICVEKNMLTNYFIPMLNHLMDNSKSEERNMARKYVPVVVDLLLQSLKGDKSSLEAVNALAVMTSEYVKIVTRKAKLLRLLFLLIRYKGVLYKDTVLVENTRFFVRSTQESDLLYHIKHYVRSHVRDVTISDEKKDVRIGFEGEDFSLNSFIQKTRDDPLAFPEDWQELYDRMFQKHMPENTREYGNCDKYLLSRLGSIMRKACGENPQKLSRADDFYLTEKFMM